MPKVPQSETQVNYLACQFQDIGEECCEILSKFSVDFRPSPSRENGHKKCSHKFLHSSGPQIPQGLNQNSFIATCWELAGPNKQAANNFAILLLHQERQGVPAREGSRLVAFPRPSRAQSEKATSRDPLSSRDPLPL